jgi:hypothetical protein
MCAPGGARNEKLAFCKNVRIGNFQNRAPAGGDPGVFVHRQVHGFCKTCTWNEKRLQRINPSLPRVETDQGISACFKKSDSEKGEEIPRGLKMLRKNATAGDKHRKGDEALHHFTAVAARLKVGP